jgi:GNAT superfamily N-acetyltransferase
VSVDVSPVTSRRDVRDFVELPFRLHSTSPQWVPPLRLERYAFLSRRFNAYFRHADARLFLARRDGAVVGRISAQVDHAFNDFHRTRWGMFGFLEVPDDPEAFGALLAAAEGWLREHGCDHMIGPMDFSMNDESGVLIEGFDRPPMIRQPWHPPYVQRLCEDAGLAKAVDLLTWEISINDRPSIRPAIFEIAKRARERHGMTVRHMTRRSLRRDLDAFAEVYNSAWSGNWGFVPYSKEDLDAYALDLQLVFDKRWFMVAENREGDVVGVAISPLDVNQVLRRMNGRLLPLGWLDYLRRGRIIDQIRVGFLGVKPEYQHTGVATLLYLEHFDQAVTARQTHAEMGWILETNPINKGMRALGGRVVKRFRVYERALSPAASSPVA